MRELERKIQIVLAVAHILMLLKKKCAVRRRYGVRPLFRKRIQFGDGHNLLEELKFDHAMFFNYTRLTYQRFEYLLSLVGPKLRKKKNMKTVLLPHQRLAMTLRFLAVGDCLPTLSFAYRCGRSTCCQIVRETLKAIVEVLHQIVIPTPNKPDQWKEIAGGFWHHWNIPHCLGAIDGKHIQIQAPQASGSVYFNYKKTFSTVWMAAADADYAFIFVDVGSEGSLGDSQVFKESIFGKKMAERKLNFPEAECLPNTDKKVEYFFAGDGAFQLQTCLMKPYAARKMSLREAVYNYRFSRARRVVENAFGILVARWRILRQPLCCKLETADFIVLAAVCLHNFIIRSREKEVRERYIPERFLDTERTNWSVQTGLWQRHVAGDSAAILPASQTRSRNPAKCAVTMRETLADFFSGVGAVPWQLKRIRNGFWGAYVNRNELPLPSESETDSSVHCATKNLRSSSQMGLKKLKVVKELPFIFMPRGST